MFTLDAFVERLLFVFSELRGSLSGLNLDNIRALDRLELYEEGKEQDPARGTGEAADGQAATASEGRFPRALRTPCARRGGGGRPGGLSGTISTARASRSMSRHVP